MDDTMMHDHSLVEEPVSIAPVPPRQFANEEVPPSVSDTFFSVIEPETSASSRTAPDPFDTPGMPSVYETPRFM